MSGSTHPEVKAFLFDMGDVLIKFSHARMFAQLSEVLERPVDEVKRLFQDTGLFVGYDRGDIDDDEAIARIEAFVGRPIDHRRLLLAMSDIFEPSPGMFELLTELKRAGFEWCCCRIHVGRTLSSFANGIRSIDCLTSTRCRSKSGDEAGSRDLQRGDCKGRRSTRELLLHRRHSSVRGGRKSVGATS